AGQLAGELLGDLVERAICDGLALVAAAAVHHGLARVRRAQELLDQGALARSRRAAHEHQLGLARARAREALVEHAPLVLPAHEAGPHARLARTLHRLAEHAGLDLLRGRARARIL